MKTAKKINVPHSAGKDRYEDCDELFLQLIDELATADLPQVARDAECSPQTLHNWLHGATYNPHLNTVRRVARALGFKLVLSRGTVNPLRRVK